MGEAAPVLRKMAGVGSGRALAAVRPPVAGRVELVAARHGCRRRARCGLVAALLAACFLAATQPARGAREPYLVAQTTDLWQSAQTVEAVADSAFGAPIALGGGVMAAAGGSNGIHFVSVFVDTDPTSADGS